MRRKIKYVREGYRVHNHVVALKKDECGLWLKAYLIPAKREYKRWHNDKTFPLKYRLRAIYNGYDYNGWIF